MREIKSYRDLDVWQLGIELAVDCYALTSRSCRRTFRADWSNSKGSRVHSFERGGRTQSPHPHSNNAYRNHVSIALGSAGELDTQFEIARRLHYLSAGAVRAANEKLDRVGQMLRRLQQSLEVQSHVGK